VFTREIPREQWKGFFDNFSKQHEGWIVTLEVLGSDIGDQEEATRLPLVGMSADLKSRESRIEVIVGGRPDAHLTHVINTPNRVWLKQPEEEAHEAVEVESEDGSTTLVRFLHVPPEEAERQLPEKT
jgi:Family of unknown function (DUF5335)